MQGSLSERIIQKSACERILQAKLQAKADISIPQYVSMGLLDVLGKTFGNTSSVAMHVARQALPSVDKLFQIAAQSMLSSNQQADNAMTGLKHTKIL